jgi:hypothetical protein
MLDKASGAKLAIVDHIIIRAAEAWVEERRQGECSIGDSTKSRSMGGTYLNKSRSKHLQGLLLEEVPLQRFIYLWFGRHSSFTL